MTDYLVNSKDGSRIYYECHGQGSRALVFVHGWLGNGQWWSDQARAFSSQYKVVLMDLAGHGRSDKNRSVWSVQAYAEDIAAVVQQIEATSSILIGHSMSGANVVQGALDLPGKISGLVLVDTLLDLDMPPPEDQINAMMQGLQKDYHGTLEYCLNTFLLKPSSPDAVRRRLREEMGRFEPGLAAALLKPFYQCDVRPLASRLEVPVRAINADTFPTALEANRKYFKDYNVTLMHQVGHYPMMEKADEFNRILQAILSDF